MDKACRVPGVLAVLTGADAKAEGLGGIGVYRLPTGFGGPKTFWPSRPVLALDWARHLGDGVVLIVAETLASARNASELVTLNMSHCRPMCQPMELWHDAAGPLKVLM